MIMMAMLAHETLRLPSLYSYDFTRLRLM